MGTCRGACQSFCGSKFRSCALTLKGLGNRGLDSPDSGTALASAQSVLELILDIRSCPTGSAAMIQAFAALMFEAKVQRGCVDCQLYAETGRPQSLHYVEQWSTLEDLESQLRSQRFGMLLATMETAAEAPKLEVRTVSDQRGLDYVRTVRLSGEHPLRGGPAIRLRTQSSKS